MPAFLLDILNWNKTELFWNAWSVIQLMSHYMHNIQQDWMGRAVQGWFILSDQHIVRHRCSGAALYIEIGRQTSLNTREKSKGGQCENISIKQTLLFAAALWISNRVWSARTKRKITQETETLLQHCEHFSLQKKKLKDTSN